MIRRAVDQLGTGVVTAVLTLISVGLSIGMAAVLDRWIKGGVESGDLIIAGTIPAILAPALSYSFLRLLERQAETEARLQRLAREDPLTGLANRRHFFTVAEREWARSRRHGRDLSLILADLDQFKKINDTHGHRVGDDALQHLAGVMKATVRGSDLIARYGGEEFVMLLPETDLIGAVQVGERLRRNVDRLAIPTSHGPLRVTISVGVAARNREMRSLDDLVTRADNALYGAKESGRNLVWSDPSPGLSSQERVQG